MADETITKRRVTMRNAVVRYDDKGNAIAETHEAIDYVRPDILDAYVANAEIGWASVVVSDEPDAGPAGYHGETYVPDTLDHPLAGRTFAATTPED